MNKKDFIEFCQILLELLEAHLSLDQALLMIQKSNQTKQIVRSFAGYILTEIGYGSQFSRSLSLNSYYKIPQHYIHLFSSEEQTGSISKSLAFICHTEKRKQKAQENIMRASVYPLIIIFFVSLGTYFLFKMQHLFIYGENTLRFSGGHLGAILFLISSILSFFVGVYFVFQDTKQVHFFYTCLFYLEAGFDQALENSILQFPLGSKIRHTLIQSIASIEDGKNITKAFAATNFFDSFFLMHVEYGLEMGNILSAVRAAYTKELQKIEKRQTYFISLCEPYMIICVGIYLAIMMYLTIIPLMTSFGGIL